MDILADKVLVLNRNCFPLCVMTVERALRLLFQKKALVMDHQWVSYDIEAWSTHAFGKLDRAVRTPSRIYIAPEVIKLTDHDKVFSKNINLTSQNVFLRDDFECQYCGASKDLTVDHVIPRSRAKEFNMDGRINSWSNLVTCCRQCNGKKDNMTPKEAGMVLRSKPKRPTAVRFRLTRTWKESWKSYVSPDD